jgi:hypothetical protein
MPHTLHRAAGVEYSEIYNLEVFKCEPLRSSLQPHQCADRWRNAQVGSACNGCHIGAQHAGQKPKPPRSMRLPCIRCRSTEQRLISAVFCVSCFNRTREVVRGRNAKGKFPRCSAAKLHEAVAMIHQPEASAALDRIYVRNRTRNSALGICYGHKPGTPTISVLGPDHLWLECVVRDGAELERIVARMLPGAVIEDSEIYSSLADKWLGRQAVVTRM